MKRNHELSGKARRLLAVMTIVCIGLILITMSTSLVTQPVRQISGVIVTPFQKGINAVGQKITDLFSGFNDVRRLTAENEELKAQISELSQKNNELVQNQTELSRLEALYALDKKYSEYPKIAAQVIAKDPGNWYSTFVVNRGTSSGIAVNMNVIGAGGLIGIVTEVGTDWARVRSIIDDESNVSGMASNTSETCIVTGNLLEMEAGKIDFDSLRDDDNQVVEGTSIVTSNISNKYLSGLLIGYVSDIEIDSNNLTKSGTIIPAADFRTLREVLIITELKQTQE